MPDYSSVLKSINARDDSLFMGPTEKAMFNHSKNHKRCILLAEGFYEWRRRGKERVPFYTKRRDGNLMLMAAIYDIAQIQGSEEPLYTYATITTNASPQLDWLHDRMPVLIPNGDHEKIRMWLDPNLTWNSSLEAMLKPCDEFMEAEEPIETAKHSAANRVYALETYQVDEKVNSVKNDSPEFAKPWNSSSNKKTLTRFFVAKAAYQNMPASLAATHETGDDAISELKSEQLRLEWEQEQEPEQPASLAKISQPEKEIKPIETIDIDTTDSRGGQIKKNIKEDEDEENRGLQRALELSMQEQDRENSNLPCSDNVTHEYGTENISMKHEKSLTDAAASVDLLVKRRNELQQEEEEMKKVLELSLLQAIADGHDDTNFQDEAQFPRTGQASDLTKKEQEELEKAIAASLKESDVQHEVVLSQKTSTSSTTTSVSSPGPKKSTTSVNSTPKKRKSSVNTSASPGGGSGSTSKSRKSNQDVKITSFFQHTTPP
ncbi:hypothetical protein BGX27_009070 [Mortierella sp. AM989]|nr:hypothetical protein BGX27_009070 [Mortierella sp. AM989]